MVFYPNRRLATVLVALLFLAALAASCGSSSSGSESPSLTKAEFIKQGDAICERGQKEFAGEVEAFTKEKKWNPSITLTSAQQEEVIRAVFVPSLQAQADELEKLGVPSGEEGQANAIVEELQSALAEAEDDPSKLLGPSPGSLATAADLARKFGFKVCLNRF
jgi:hypothetical protein